MFPTDPEPDAAGSMKKRRQRRQQKCVAGGVCFSCGLSRKASIDDILHGYRGSGVCVCVLCDSIWFRREVIRCNRVFKSLASYVPPTVSDISGPVCSLTTARTLVCFTGGKRPEYMLPMLRRSWATCTGVCVLWKGQLLQGGRPHDSGNGPVKSCPKGELLQGCRLQFASKFLK